MAWTICTDSFEFSDGTIGTPVPFPTSYMSAGTLQRVDFVSGGSFPFVVEKPIIGEWTIGPNAEGSYFSIHVTEYKKGKTVQGNITFWHEPSKRSLYESLGFNGEDGTKLAIGLYYDEDNKKAGFIKYEGTSTGYVETTISDPGYPNTAKYFYNFLKANIHVPITVKVSYIVPDDEYTYCNLTWKKDYEPEDKDDGYTATLLKDESVINVTGLEDNSKYIFKIFTNKSESNPFIYECGIKKKVKLSDLIPDDINTRHVEIFTTTDSAWNSAYQYANNNPNDLVVYRHSSSHPDNRYDKETNSYDIQDIQEWSDYFIFYPLKHPITVYGGEQKITFNPNSHYHAYDWGGIAVVVFDYPNGKEESTGSASCYNGAPDQFSVGETRTIKTTLNEPVYTKHVVFRSNYGNWTINDIYLTIKG